MRSIRITVSIPKRYYVRIKKQTEEKGYESLSEYIRYLVRKDALILMTDAGLESDRP